MKRVAIVLFILLLLFPIISAIEVDFKEEFAQGETFMAKISGNFLEPPLKENVFFYKGHVKTALEYDLTKIDEDYYLYAQLADKEEGNYSFVVKNVKYYAGAQTSEEDIEQVFKITNKTADFTVNPGHVITAEDFFIEVQNLQNNEITIKIGPSNTSSSSSWNFFASLFGGGESDEESEDLDFILLKSGEVKKINFDIGKVSTNQLKIISLNTDNLEYEIPVYIYTNTPKKKEQSFEFLNSDFVVNLSTKSNTIRNIYLNNTGEETLKNILVFVSESLNPYITLSINEVDELKPGEDVQIKLEITSGEEEKQIEGEVRARIGENLSDYFNLNLNFMKNYIPLDNQTEVPKKEACLELNGTICGEGEKCEGATTYARDGVCCLENCKETTTSSSGKLIGWMIVIVLVVVLIWFFKFRYSGAKRKIDLFKESKGRK